MAERYDPQSFEPRWAEKWHSGAVYAVPDDPGGKPKRFVMEMFPYPSGDLHMGHVENYTIADAMARYWRMRGYEVMHPMGYDAFGLPAENAAIKRGTHPEEWTLANIAKMRASFLRLGYSYDWGREVISCLPDYYKWNQWIFLEMFKRGLAYRKTSPVNWCPVDKTVLAKEQISTGVCWRCGSVPEIRDLTQWFLKITDYSDRLLDDMDQLDWAESLLTMQRNWIGRSEGAEVVFKLKVDGSDEELDFPVFTTRPDTLWGATFFVLAAEHPAAAGMVKGTTSGGWVHRVRERGPPPDRDRAAGGQQDQGRNATPRRGHQPGQRRRAAGLRRRLRAHGLRHRRHHGGPGARPARLRLRPRARHPDPGGRSARRSWTSSTGTP